VAHDDDGEILRLAQLMLADVAEIRRDQQALLEEIRSTIARLELPDRDYEREREKFRARVRQAITAAFDQSAERLDTMLSTRFDRFGSRTLDKLGRLEQKIDLILERQRQREGQ